MGEARQLRGGAAGHPKGTLKGTPLPARTPLRRGPRTRRAGAGSRSVRGPLRLGSGCTQNRTGVRDPVRTGAAAHGTVPRSWRVATHRPASGRRPRR
ncbi:hypothetical protein PAI11_15290 [Patulibacter medicamentivorans]|uniref:Uncharacterized protein n=1 Tax=Patulibacter medicamentivorans TaxID=1097667 RepID=H0E403_9ACTN|nr:hypothetical protein PAI11_15290 [Patulibacter medicamentivorans]